MLADAFGLSLRYLRSAPFRTAVLVFGLATALTLPALTFLAARLVEDELLERAEASPIVIGAKGNDST